MGMSNGTNSPCFIPGFRAGHSDFWDNTSAWNFPNVRTFDCLAFKPIFSPLHQAGRTPPHSPGFTGRPGFLWPHEPLQNKWSFFLGQDPALLRFVNLVHSLVFRCLLQTINLSLTVNSEFYRSISLLSSPNNQYR